MTGPLSVTRMADLVAAELRPGSCVNLGIGMPLAVAAQLPAEAEVVLHSENGILGMGPADQASNDPNLIDAAKRPVSLRPGGSYISHADSFALIRGGHIDVSVMGALQVSARGDLANWWDGSGVPGVGGAMDLATGARRVFVMMRHTAGDGASKIVETCSLPLTAAACVERIFTDYGVFGPREDGTVGVVAIAEGVDLDLVRKLTGPPLVVPADLRTIPVSAP